MGSLNNKTTGKLLAIVGPTASGKTALSLRLAEVLQGVIVSADSRQVYKFLDIGTAKPTSTELKRIPHYFLDCIDPAQEYNAGKYGVEARRTIDEILQSEKQPILVGGSGLYVRAVIDGLFEGPARNAEIREQLEEEAQKYGAEFLLEKLKKVDPLSAEKMDETRVHRIVRALEVFYSTGQPISSLHAKQNTQPSFRVVQFGLQWERKTLYQRIEQRVDDMIQQGFVEEVRGLLLKGYDASCNALNTVGYKEIIEYLKAKISKDEMIQQIKQNTRRFAKRQLTWFRADKRIEWIELNEESDIAKTAEVIIRKFQTSN